MMREHRKGIAVGVALGLLTAATIAVAAWLVSVDNAPGRGHLGTLAAPTVSAGTINPASKCFPGGTCAGAFNIVNPNNGALIVAEVHAASVDLTTPSCAFYLHANDITGLSVPVPAGTTNGVIVPDAFKLDSNAPTTCQGESLVENVTLAFSTP